MFVGTSLAIAGCAGSRSTQSQLPEGETHAEDQHEQSALHNLHALTPELYSAAEPVGELAYDELAALGIRTVISVDGVAPDKELAQRYGIRVVHIPTTYDGISEKQSKELAYAMATMPRPIFVNCHHGKHRGPAAICVGAIGSGDITNEQALEFMTIAKTSPKYKGLWKAAESARALNASELHDDSIVLVEAAVIDDFVEGMAELSRLSDLINDCADYGFEAPENHPDLAPISLAGQMHNLFRDMEDDQETVEGGPEFLQLLIQSRDLASLLETQIERDDIDGAYRSLQLLMESCSDCHNQFGRNG
tara:strand:+ start:25985 stop:26902 length:918 start_codon:yes stop_codon:yes gene_type:complete